MNYRPVSRKVRVTEARTNQGHFLSVLSRPHITTQIIKIFRRQITLDDLARDLGRASTCGNVPGHLISSGFGGAFPHYW
ncbi:hypothetical protein J6590_028892 [Homalodisca vitripennis]|nr:hypothetical protein J6590_028892 [Homalodisca vitripennis]